jgi:hypothetical protein
LLTSEGWHRWVRSALAPGWLGCHCPTSSSLLFVLDAQQIASLPSGEPLDCAVRFEFDG